MNRKNTILSLLTAGTLVVFPSFTYAESNQNQLNSIDSQLSSKQQDLQNKQQQKSQIETDISSLQKKLDDLQAAASTNEQQLKATNGEISQTQNQIKEKQSRIAALEQQIAKRQELIKKRLQSVQEQPRTTLITEVVANSGNLADLIENLYSVTLILNSDNDILKAQDRDQQEVKNEKTAIETKQNELKNYELTLKQKQQDLDSNKQQQQTVMNAMSDKLKQTTQDIMSTEEAQKLLESQKSALQQAIALENAKVAAAKTATSTPTTGSTSSSSGSNYSQPSNTGGFIKPAAGAFTSGFGGRWGAMHYGVDIAGSGTIPIVAAADGVVIQSYLSSSYGNVVFLAHSINGKTYTTVYAHMQNRMVSEGQVVKQGQQLGIMGSTGESTGQHLHFELHIGEWNYAKSNAVDPMPYIQ
ncbi:murein hydrolase activator EnvC family protein [Ectobacillus sp. sgz5001026]|uniref:murein hydrolase activator EnvC family protein n=1 Tax=Ectobacillus sp. sgz5001026 TaxID=3242473 RepID=UPI0036D3952A